MRMHMATHLRPGPGEAIENETLLPQAPALVQPLLQQLQVRRSGGFISREPPTLKTPTTNAYSVQYHIVNPGTCGHM